MVDNLIPADMLGKLDGFDRQAEKNIAAFVRPLELQTLPPLIYHYTNDIGLRGILETGHFWLTDIFQLNDTSELTHSLSIAVSLLNSRAKNGLPEVKIFAEDFAALTQGGIQSTAHYFVCSFSSAGNDLGQWRAYADNGKGFALGFDTKELEDAFTKNGVIPIANNATFPVTYRDKQLEELHRQNIEGIFDLISLPRGQNLSSEVIQLYVQELSIRLALHTLRTGIFFKHEAYINEREYRFLEIHRGDIAAPEVKLRNRPYSLVKFREFDWRTKAKGALRRIVVGPAADREKAGRFVEDCIRQFHNTSIELSFSDIPYRTG